MNPGFLWLVVWMKGGEEPFSGSGVSVSPSTGKGPQEMLCGAGLLGPVPSALPPVGNLSVNGFSRYVLLWTASSSTGRQLEVTNKKLSYL